MIIVNLFLKENQEVMKMNKQDQVINTLKRESIKSVYDPFKDENILIVDGSGYSKIDLLVIYKMYRMYNLGVIDIDKLHILVDKYHQKRKIEDELNFLFFSQHAEESNLTDEEIEKREIELNDKLKEVEEELEKYHLLPEYVDIEYLLDDSIKNRQAELKRIHN